ncbi:MAG: hypothetical protein M3188_05520 [Actinomycetota bacterium]|nr:hypothetical protein [Actinomycetota bacterium]
MDDTVRRSALRFPRERLPGGATITAARLCLFHDADGEENSEASDPYLRSSSVPDASVPPWLAVSGNNASVTGLVPDRARHAGFSRRSGGAVNHARPCRGHERRPGASAALGLVFSTEWLDRIT